MTLRHGSLFSGIGGFDLAAEWVGWKNVFHCEWNDFGQKVLKHYWPEAESYGDITKTDFSKWRGSVDIISGGFPCQPYSSAGKRLGKEDERHLWPHMLRAIREAAPSFVVGENVRGLTNWNGGLVFDEVQTDLEALGYQVAAFLIPAAAVNAPHGRDRIWFVAYSNGRGTQSQQNLRQTLSSKKRTNSDGSEWNATDTDSNGRNQRNGKHEEQPSKRGEYAQRDIEQSDGDGNATDTMRKGYTRATSNGVQKMEGIAAQQHGVSSRSHKRNNWEQFPTQPPVCGGNDGLPSELDGITFPKWRNESIKAYGNAIVPQVAYQIFKSIQQTIK